MYSVRHGTEQGNRVKDGKVGKAEGREATKEERVVADEAGEA